ncbi:glycine zipper 2TM domain-containing protein [Dyella solisilvae]|uniref:Glycine zipper 2TM domain-containing protein n=1 Tax=Dyella solisilvae TaxID=1920168 RepID=A0A370KAG7_9GAMM|nr:glycine zipper 2TM domain-containing protein [Dyella solisilvae]RDI99645.1 glycine zipper 2TM domain-containing protein [Dyella solisilvae]
MLNPRFLVLPLAALLAVSSFAASAQSARGNGAVLVRNDGIFIRCDQCGTVEGIDQNISQGSDHSMAGTIIGGIAGGVLGNQVGKGKGNTLATVAGAVGGGYAGNRIGANSGAGKQSFTLHIRMGNGAVSNVTVADASSLRTGDLVQIDPNGNVARIQ